MSAAFAVLQRLVLYTAVALVENHAAICSTRHKSWPGHTLGMITRPTTYSFPVLSLLADVGTRMVG